MSDTIKPRILVVEDDPIVSTDLEETVRGFGFDVVGVAASGERALELLKQRRPDLVLMDIRIEGPLDGIDTASRVQSEYGVPVIYLTAHSDTATLERAKITEPYGYVLKPFDEVELRIAIEMALFRSAREGRRLQAASVTNGEPNETLRVVSKYPIFSKVPTDALAGFLDKCREVSLDQGDCLNYEGEESRQTTGFLVLSGRVAMFKGSSTGRELIVELICPGDSFGLVSGFSPDPSALTARAQTPARLLAVPRDAFLSLLGEVPELYRIFVEDLARRLREAHNFARALAHDRVEVRIASALTRLQQRIAQGEERNRILMTRQELADLTGTTVETAIRVTRSFEKAGILDLSQAGIMRILRPEELEEVSLA
jgi:CRP-like cAMP-binding protein/AmiR/NasT family two-component response regulator